MLSRIILKLAVCYTLSSDSRMHTSFETGLVYSRRVPPESIVRTLTERTRPSELGIIVSIPFYYIHHEE